MAQFTSYPAPTTPLTGTEQLVIAQSGNTKTATVAQVLGATAALTPTSVTTTGTIVQNRPQNSPSSSSGTVLTAASLINGYIFRSGPSTAFTDTTDTAANIVAAVPNAVANVSFTVRILNTTSVTMTLAGGTGVTISGTIAAGSWREYVGVITNISTPTVVFTNIGGGTN